MAGTQTTGTNAKGKPDQSTAWKPRMDPGRQNDLAVYGEGTVGQNRHVHALKSMEL